MVTTANTIAGKIARLRACRDFQRNPVRAVSARLIWKWRWAVTNRPCTVKLAGTFNLSAPNSASACFMRSYGYSEPETARFVMRFLKPGMTFLDIGAHIGEYSLLAGRSVGPTGRVDAFEPQPAIFEFLSLNVTNSKLSNISLHNQAIADRTGVVQMSLHSDPAKSSIGALPSPADIITVPAITLDELLHTAGVSPNLIKVDAEGAERLILKGAESLLALPKTTAPAWIMEYDPDNCARFGYHPDELLRVFKMFEYATFWITDSGELEPSSLPQPWYFGRNCVAVKQAPQL